jgi:hypothetical protein
MVLSITDAFRLQRNLSNLRRTTPKIECSHGIVLFVLKERNHVRTYLLGTLITMAQIAGLYCKPEASTGLDDLQRRIRKHTFPKQADSDTRPPKKSKRNKNLGPRFLGQGLKGSYL